MTKLKLSLMTVTFMTACAMCACQTPEKRSGAFIDKEQAIIKEHATILVRMGHMSSQSIDSMDTSVILGTYSWHGDEHGSFGAYSFYAPAFEQAKRAWFLHGQVLEGSNELWPRDDWDTANQ